MGTNNPFWDNRKLSQKQSGPKPPWFLSALELRGWTPHLSTWTGSGACRGKDSVCGARGHCTQSKFQVMRNKPICNMNYCQLLSQNGYVENITLSEIIVCYFHVFTLRIHPDTSVVKAVTSKYELYFICDLWYTQSYQDKENVFVPWVGTSLLCCVQILPQEQFSWAK